jgi:hypothetical protein
MTACFNTMVENGYPPSFAYAKAIRSLRSVIDVMDEIGIEPYVSGGCSRTCEFAIRTRGPRVINEEEIKKIFAETERGEFARDWMQEFALGMPTLHRMRRTGANSVMEKTGRAWREQFANSRAAPPMNYPSRQGQNVVVSCASIVQPRACFAPTFTRGAEVGSNGKFWEVSMGSDQTVSASTQHTYLHYY